MDGSSVSSNQLDRGGLKIRVAGGVAVPSA
jgi:hypothetical protein